MVGTLGNIIFEVSDEKIKTFKSLNLSKKANYATHNIINKKGLSEFTGFEPMSIKININLNQNLGVNVQEELNKINKAFSGHEVLNFILNGQPVGEGKFVIENISEDMKVIGKNGEIISCEINLDLKEYI